MINMDRPWFAEALALCFYIIIVPILIVIVFVICLLSSIVTNGARYFKNGVGEEITGVDSPRGFVVAGAVDTSRDGVIGEFSQAANTSTNKTIAINRLFINVSSVNSEMYPDFKCKS